MAAPTQRPTLLGPGTRNVLFDRVYNDGPIDLVVTTPREGRVVTQFMFNDQDSRARMKFEVTGTRDS